MSSTIIQPIADQLVLHLQALNLSVPTDGWAAKSITPPAAELEIPNIVLTDLETAERQLGAFDWTLNFTVRLFFDLRRTLEAQAAAIDLLEQWVARLQGDPTLGGLVEDCKLVTADRIYAGVEQGQLPVNRPLIGYETAVRVLQLVP